MKAKEITLGAIMIALTSIILYSTSLIPINTLTILTIASAIIPICIIRSDIKTASFVYIASSLIAFFLVPINISILYVMFFGIYGIIKFFAERMKNIYIEYLLKILFFGISFLITFIIFKNVIGINVVEGIQKVVEKFISTNVRGLSGMMLYISANVVFLIYDYALTLIITFYMDRIHNKSRH